jgi:hypothetical protein
MPIVLAALFVFAILTSLGPGLLTICGLSGRDL